MISLRAFNEAWMSAVHKQNEIDGIAYPEFTTFVAEPDSDNDEECGRCFEDPTQWEPEVEDD